MNKHGDSVMAKMRRSTLKPSLPGKPVSSEPEPVKPGELTPSGYRVVPLED